MRPELHDRGDDLGRDLREFGDEHRGERLLDLRLVLLEAAGALDLEKVLVFFDMYLSRRQNRFGLHCACLRTVNLRQSDPLATQL